MARRKLEAGARGDGRLRYNLRRLLSINQLSQAEVTRAMGITRGPVTHIMRGGDTQVSSLFRIAAAMSTCAKRDIDVSELLAPIRDHATNGNSLDAEKARIAAAVIEMLTGKK